jgi:AcrR family transcriptional regulator
MARPTKTDDPRRSILHAARALVVAQGHEKLSLRAVAAEAGFSPASLYEYFDGRDDLLAAVAQDASARFGAALALAADRGKTPAVALVEVGLAYVDFAREHKEDFLLLFGRLDSGRQRFSDAVPTNSPYAVVMNGVREALGARGRRATQATVEQLSYLLWATAHGMAMLQVTHLRDFEADFEAADRAGLTALVRGLDLAD